MTNQLPVLVGIDGSRDGVIALTRAATYAQLYDASLEGRHGHPAPDHPVLVLARESQDADLVVAGGLGRTAFSELRMGSVARGLLYHSHSPVAVVHHPEP